MCNQTLPQTSWATKSLISQYWPCYLGCWTLQSTVLMSTHAAKMMVLTYIVICCSDFPNNFYYDFLFMKCNVQQTHTHKTQFTVVIFIQLPWPCSVQFKKSTDCIESWCSNLLNCSNSHHSYGQSSLLAQQLTLSKACANLSLQNYCICNSVTMKHLFSKQLTSATEKT